MNIGYDFGHAIHKAFSMGERDPLTKLTTFTFEELEELKEYYELEYSASQALHVKGRIKTIEEAIMVKQGDEEEIWDSLT